jgi:hypothetical protein
MQEQDALVTEEWNVTWGFVVEVRDLSQLTNESNNSGYLNVVLQAESVSSGLVALL